MSSHLRCRDMVLTDHHTDAPAVARLIGMSAAVRGLRQTITRIGTSDAAVLIVGESGSGKELVAEAIHQASPRCKAPFIAVNCAALPATLVEAELFGFNKGSFTGASRPHAGLFERACGGTLLLDEITEMPLDMQSCLLRVLETKRFTRIGGSDLIGADVRILAATNRAPQQAFQDGRLRADLFYRLAVLPVDVPPLREREGDVDLLIDYFLEVFNERYASVKTVSAELRHQFGQYFWPGNVRELRNAMERAYVLADHELLPVPLMSAVDRPPDPTAAASNPEAIEVPVGTKLHHAERLLIESTLRHCSGNRQRAADLLGCSLKTLYNKLQSYRGALADAGAPARDDGPRPSAAPRSGDPGQPH
jgi:transcriptional regulator with PAS, ATPase and Fis domain